MVYIRPFTTFSPWNHEGVGAGWSPQVPDETYVWAEDTHDRAFLKMVTYSGNMVHSWALTTHTSTV